MIDLRRPYSWDDINEQLKNQITTNGTVRYYQSLAQATLEVVIAFQSLYSHKRQAYISLGLGTHADEALLFLSRQGIKNSEFFSETNFDEKKTLFCLLDQDDAITAEIYGERYKLDDKIFRISIYHHLQHFEKKSMDVGETEVAIYSGGEKGAVAILGKRCATLPGVIANTLRWNTTIVGLLPWAQRAQNTTWVQDVEKGWAGGKALLINTARIFDRAILTWSDLEGEALRQTLIRDHGVAAQSLESLSLSRWNELKLIPQFEKRGWTPEEFRGALLISSELSKDSQFQKKLDAAVQQTRARSQI